MDMAVEIGDIFKLGSKYSESMGARVLDRNGKEVMRVMGCYGIGIDAYSPRPSSRKRENGFWLPAAIAPFQIVVTPTNVGDVTLKSTAEGIAS